MANYGEVPAGGCITRVIDTIGNQGYYVSKCFDNDGTTPVAPSAEQTWVEGGPDIGYSGDCTEPTCANCIGLDCDTGTCCDAGTPPPAC